MLKCRTTTMIAVEHPDRDVHLNSRREPEVEQSSASYCP
jgi:hypothetical protein